MFRKGIITGIREIDLKHLLNFTKLLKIQKAIMLIPKIETKSYKEIKQYQENRLQELLAYLENNSGFYSERFRAKLRVAPRIKFESVNNINKIKFSEENRKSVNFIDKRGI